MRLRIQSILLFVVLLVIAACTPQATPTAPAVAPTLAQPTAEPTLAPTPATTEPKTLTVLAAASLTESFGEIGKLFESQNPGVTVSFNFAGSQQLAQQLDQGVDADVFASASKKYMDTAVQSKRVNAADPKTFAKNRLVVIFPKDNPGAISGLKDLAKPSLKLDLADKSVPVGQYSLDFLDKAAQDPGFTAQFKDAVLKNVVSYEDNVKAVVTKVSLGEVDAGIVYVTDITAAAALKIGKLDIPDALNTVATYPIAPISNSKNLDLAKAFVALVLSPQGQAVLAKYGFIPPA
ncbi:MAG: molybdate ABC transporter substrate-binding protein [Anaerolineaceae bacterium]|nr:molybdate ABC transporter substrate-binding protein [Anaerolineaceae bacterium]